MVLHVKTLIVGISPAYNHAILIENGENSEHCFKMVMDGIHKWIRLVFWLIIFFWFEFSNQSKSGRPHKNTNILEFNRKEHTHTYVCVCIYIY